MFLSKEFMLKREQKGRDNWFRIREKGRLKYIFKYGVLFWGLWMSSFLFIYDHWNTPVDNWLIELAKYLIIWPLYGFIVGLVSWNENEKRVCGIKRLKTKLKKQSYRT